MSRRSRPSKTQKSTAAVPSDEKRSAFLHEAGHAVVALEHGLIIEQVMCDGETGFCHADLPAENYTKLQQLLHDGQTGQVTPLHVLTEGAQLYFGRFATLVGELRERALSLGGQFSRPAALLTTCRAFLASSRSCLGDCNRQNPIRSGSRCFSVLRMMHGASCAGVRPTWKSSP